MSNERMKILELLENGDITAEEANKLLKAIENNSNNSNNDSINFTKVSNKVNDILGLITKKTSSMGVHLGNEIKNLVKNINISNTKNSFYKEFEFELDNIKKDLTLKSLNGEMVLKGYNGNKITLKAIYIPKNTKNNLIFCNQDSNKYVLSFNENDFEKVSIDVLIPKKCLQNIYINCINSNISLSSMNFANIFCETSACNCIIENSDGDNININNINGKIIIRNTKANNLKVCNINEYVKLNNIDIKNISLDILNGEIGVLNDYLNLFDDYKWRFETQNMPINIQINTDNINYSIDAQTSLGKINILKNNLAYYEKSDKRVLAKIERPYDLFKNLDLIMQTTNSAIILS